MKTFDNQKVEEAIRAIDSVCLHCKKCDESACHVYNTYGEMEKLK